MGKAMKLAPELLLKLLVGVLPVQLVLSLMKKANLLYSETVLLGRFLRTGSNNIPFDGI